MSFDLEDKIKWEELAPSLQNWLLKMRHDLDQLRIDFDNHDADMVRHITQAERDRWNAAADKIESMQDGNDTITPGTTDITGMILRGGITVVGYTMEYNWSDPGNMHHRMYYSINVTVFGNNALVFDQFVAFEGAASRSFTEAIFYIPVCVPPLYNGSNPVNKFNIGNESCKTTDDCYWYSVDGAELLSSHGINISGYENDSCSIVRLKNHVGNYVHIWFTFRTNMVMTKSFTYNSDVSPAALGSSMPSGYTIITDMPAMWNFTNSTYRIIS